MSIGYLDRVRWKLKDGSTGTGTAIEGEMDGHVLVAVDPDPSAPTQFLKEAHRVIYCTVTWLEVIG